MTKAKKRKNAFSPKFSLEVSASLSDTFQMAFLSFGDTVPRPHTGHGFSCWTPQGPAAGIGNQNCRVGQWSRSPLTQGILTFPQHSQQGVLPHWLLADFGQRPHQAWEALLCSPPCAGAAPDLVLLLCPFHWLVQGLCALPAVRPSHIPTFKSPAVFLVCRKANLGLGEQMGSLWDEWKASPERRWETPHRSCCRAAERAAIYPVVGKQAGGWSKPGTCEKSSLSRRREESSSCLQGTSAPGQPNKSVMNSAAITAGWLLLGFFAHPAQRKCAWEYWSKAMFYKLVTSWAFQPCSESASNTQRDIS